VGARDTLLRLPLFCSARCSTGRSTAGGSSTTEVCCPHDDSALHSYSLTPFILCPWRLVHFFLDLPSGLLLLLAVLLMRSRVWRKCHLRIFTVAGPLDNSIEMDRLIRDYLYELRIAASVEIVELVRARARCLLTHRLSPRPPSPTSAHACPAFLSRWPIARNLLSPDAGLGGFAVQYGIVERV